MINRMCVGAYALGTLGAVFLALTLVGCPVLSAERAHAPPPLGPARAARSEAPGLRVDGEYAVVVTKLPFTLTCGEKADDYVWTYPAAWKAEEDGARLKVTAAPEGTYSVRLRTLTINFEAKNTVRNNYSMTLAVGKAAPPPDPKPDPRPGPGPGPAAPIAGDGFRVLIVEETGERAKLPASQLAVLFSKQVRDYLQSKAAVGPDGKTKEWRIYDKDVDLSGESKTWRDAMARPRTSLPWVIVSDGKTGHEGPLPANVPATLELLKKYGGPRRRKVRTARRPALRRRAA